MSSLVELVKRSLSGESAAEFTARVETQADALREEMADGSLDNEGFAVGMEMEVYAIDSSEESTQPQLSQLSEPFFESGATKELGLHNAEINTRPDRFDGDGLARQAATLEADFERAREAALVEGCDLVLDAMWTSPPAEGSESYLCSVEQQDGVTVAQNMRRDPRYAALDNQALAYAEGALSFSAPGVERTFPTILFESLATSIQPHLQIPDAEAFPAYYNTAIRTLGPVLALGTNSPFLPPDLYTDISDPHHLVEESHHELRIAVFEQSVNQSPNDKVRVPDDIEIPSEILTQVVEDDLYAPFLREWVTDECRESFADEHWEYRYKRASYWRWLRCVVRGDAVVGAGDERSVRIEYRPIPTQPTIRDVVGMQVLTVGLIRGLVAGDHPLSELEWEAAERSFYNAAVNGLDATLDWVTADGERTDSRETIFSELFEYARLGLTDAGVPQADIDRYLDPIERRWQARVTPSIWKKNRVREGLDAGLAFETAVTEMQAEYIERSHNSETFAEWM